MLFFFWVLKRLTAGVTYIGGCAGCGWGPLCSYSWLIPPVQQQGLEVTSVVSCGVIGGRAVLLTLREAA